MKKSYITSTVIALSMIISFSCQDLDEKPVGLLSPEGLFQTPEDVALSVNGGYSLIGHENFWGRKLSLSLLLRGDMVTIGDQTTAARRIEVDQMNMSANSGMVSSFYPMGYQAIGALNVAIAGAELVEADEAELNPVVAEARFLRAFIYYNFVRLFGEIVYVDRPIANPNDAYSAPQASEDEVYTGIIEDLEFAKIWLPDVADIRSRPGKGTAAAFLASVYLTRENFQGAYDEAKYVIDNSGTFGYSLEGEFANLFDPSQGNASNEVVFEIDFIGADAGGNPSALGGTNASTDYIASVTGPRGDERFGTDGWSVAVPSLDVFDSWDERDYRRSVSFDTLLINGGVEVAYPDWGGIARNVPRPHIGKYFRAMGQAGLPTGSNNRDSEIDYNIMRYAEVLLIAAEALNEVNGGPSAEAENYVNLVRERARREMDGDASNDRNYPANIATGLNQTSFRDAVLEERRLELAFEFGRWFDIKRKGMGEEAFSAGGRDPQNFNPAKDYLFPKYQQDVDVNDNLDQNNGY